MKDFSAQLTSSKESEKKLKKQDAILMQEEMELKEKLSKIVENRTKIRQERDSLLLKTKELLTDYQDGSDKLLAVVECLNHAQQ